MGRHVWLAEPKRMQLDVIEDFLGAYSTCCVYQEKQGLKAEELHRRSLGFAGYYLERRRQSSTSDVSPGLLYDGCLNSGWKAVHHGINSENYLLAGQKVWDYVKLWPQEFEPHCLAEFADRQLARDWCYENGDVHREVLIEEFDRDVDWDAGEMRWIDRRPFLKELIGR